MGSPFDVCLGSDCVLMSCSFGWFRFVFGLVSLFARPDGRLGDLKLLRAGNRLMSEFLHEFQ